MSSKLIKMTVSGKVQGVGFRYYTRQQAQNLGIRGYVKNLANSQVEIVAQGEAAAIDRLIEWAKAGSPAARVDALQQETVSQEEDFLDFNIRY